MAELANRLRSQFNQDFTLYGLRWLITLWAIGVIVAAWLIDNRWILAGIAAYEMLP